MSGKKNKKSSKKNKLDAERLAYDIWSFILAFCAFPKEKMNFEAGKKNSYKNDKYVSRVGTIVMAVCLYYRDEWKIMFESRLKASGFDTVEKIENCLTSLLAINREFKEKKPRIKARISLAAYSEMLLFLNYKGIDFDIGQLLNSWSRHFIEHIALCRSASDEILDNLYILAADISDFTKWITTFTQNIASPYGSRDDVSTIYRKGSKTIIKMKEEKNLQVVRTLAHFVHQAVHTQTLEPSLPADFESSTVLPGDRESPDPTLNIECGAVGGKEVSERERTRSTDVTGYSSEEFLTALPSGSESSPISLPSDREPPKSQMRVDEGGFRSRKVSRARNRLTSVTEYRSEEKLTSLPGDCKSFEPHLNLEGDAVGRKEASERDRTPSTGVAGYRSGEFPTISLSGTEMYIPLLGDCEPTKQQLRLDGGSVGSRRESKARNRITSVTEYRTGETPSSLSGDHKSYKPQLSLECGDAGGEEVSKTEWTQPTSVETCRAGERQSSKTFFEIEIEEQFALMNLSRLLAERDEKSNKRKPRN